MKPLEGLTIAFSVIILAFTCLYCGALVGYLVCVNKPSGIGHPFFMNEVKVVCKFQSAEVLK